MVRTYRLASSTFKFAHMKRFRDFHNLQNTFKYAEIDMSRRRNDRKSNSYEAAIEALNGLQSNAAYLKISYNQKLSHTEEHSRTISQVEKYLSRVGISFDQLNNLSVIHVAGTKGKGSTCATCESILRHHGYKTGFYSSPHLLEVKERIRINGLPISRKTFANNFWNVYNKLQAKKKDENDMPLYFRFLTVLAFNIFLNEKVDVAVVEVGIGGEFDCTNVLRYVANAFTSVPNQMICSKVPVVGITSLGIDHTQILGDTIEEIAWHKAGIMKNGANAYTVRQPIAALKVLKQRSIEKKCKLGVVDDFISLRKHGDNVPEVSNTNASLAVVLAHSWMTKRGKRISLEDFVKTPATQRALENLTWPGRYQIIRTNRVNYYLDGAHTPESMNVCVKWYRAETADSSRTKALIFNTTGDRDFVLLLSILRSVDFSKVCFVPNVSGNSTAADNKISESSQLSKCDKHKDTWLGLCKTIQKDVDERDVVVLPTVADALRYLNDGSYDLLVTGSLHLMGAILNILDPELSGRPDIKSNGF